MEIKLLGLRGTIPVHGEDFARFGGATSCVLVRAGDECIILDAGTGLSAVALRRWQKKTSFSMLISHPHADHLTGFPIFPVFFDAAQSCDVYLKSRDGLDARAQIERLMSPPLWPVRTDSFRAAVSFNDLPEKFGIGEVEVETMEVPHPGGSSAFKLVHAGKSLVYATDFEPREEEREFEAFAKDCSLLLIDAQYTSEEYIYNKGFGHSTIERSAELSQRCGAQRTIFIHHDPKRTDSELENLEADVCRRFPNTCFGREGEEICL